MLRNVSGALVMTAVVSIGLAPARAAQAATITFDTGLAGAGGTISWNGGAAPLVGAGIAIGSVSAVGTPISQPPLIIEMGTLSFTTGPHLGFDDSAELHSFGSGGSLTIIGAVPAAGIVAPAVLLSGTFSHADVGPFGSLNLTVADGLDFKSGLLLSQYGFSEMTPFSFSLTLLSTGPAISDSPFSRTAFSTSVANTDIPEPPSLLLLGTALVALRIPFRMARRFTHRQTARRDNR